MRDADKQAECRTFDGRTTGRPRVLVTVGIFTTRALGFAQTVEAFCADGA